MKDMKMRLFGMMSAMAETAGETAARPGRPNQLVRFWWVLVLSALVVIALVVLRRKGGRGSGAAPTDRGGRRPVSPARPRYSPETVAADEAMSTPSTRIPQHAPRETQPVEEDEKPSFATEAVEDELPTLSRYHVGVAQTIGRRVDQEDSYAISNWKDGEAVRKHGLLAAVADGVGGMDDGQIASNTLMRCFCEEFNRLDPNLSAQDKLLELTAHGQQEVIRINQAGKRCGTTLVSLLIQDDFLSTLSVGDSRIDLYRSGALLQINREHVLGRESDEQQALASDNNRLNDRRREAITSFIGKEGLRLMDRTLNPIRLLSGDRVLLMSDGVFGTLSDDEMIGFLDRPPQQAAEEIIRAVEAKAKPHQDNATIVIVGLD